MLINMKTLKVLIQTSFCNKINDVLCYDSLMAAQTDMHRNRAVFVTYLHAATAIFVEILM